MTATPTHTDTGHEALTFVPGLGHATSCACVEHHRPKPARFIWHHVLPRTCGGKTDAANLVSLCDTAHYAIHAVLYELRTNDGQLPKAPGRRNDYITNTALTGYQRAVAAGTVDRIPKESE